MIAWVQHVKMSIMVMKYVSKELNDKVIKEQRSNKI